MIDADLRSGTIYTYNICIIHKSYILLSTNDKRNLRFFFFGSRLAIPIILLYKFFKLTNHHFLPLYKNINNYLYCLGNII